MTEALPLTLLDAAIRGAVVVALLLLAGAMLRDHPRAWVAQMGGALALGLCVQVISSTPLFESLVPRQWQAPWVAVSVGNGVLFWLFVQALFNDEFALRPWHGLVWLAVAALSALNCAVLANSGSIVAPYSVGLQRAVPLLFAVLVALAAARHWRADLVEERRRLRAFIVVTGVAYTLASPVARLGSPQGRLLGATATLDATVLLVIVVGVAGRMLRMRGTHLFPVAPTPIEAADQQTPTPQPPDPAEVRLAQTLQRLMTEEQAYLREDISLASLAARLSVPEYRLRRLINQHLGHRNFNAFINGYRLDAVRAALRDPARRDLPVLTLALEAGFQSIGPFNRAFKAATGRTPTEFRKEHSADS